MDIVLIAGLWLGHTSWDAVAAELEKLGHHPVPVALPGQGAAPTDATLDDQIDAVLSAVDAADGPCVVVGHSAASTLAWLAADRRPGRVVSVVLIGGMPTTDGEQYAPFFEAEDGVMAFPGWEPFAGPDSADLSEEQKDAVQRDAVGVPVGVSEAVVRYRRADRTTTPVVMVCPEYSPEDALEWIEGGQVPELAEVDDLTLANLDSGHWPMLTRPAELAALIADAAAAVHTPVAD